MGRGAALIYAGLTAVVCLFHIAMILGAPWGHLTMGGTWSGALPVPGRIASALSCILLAAMAAVVLARSGVTRWPPVPMWAIWTVVVLQVIAVVQHVITPSPAERALWLPLIVVLLACAVLVARMQADKR